MAHSARTPQEEVVLSTVTHWLDSKWVSRSTLLRVVENYAEALDVDMEEEAEEEVVEGTSQAVGREDDSGVTAPSPRMDDVNWGMSPLCLTNLGDYLREPESQPARQLEAEVDQGEEEPMITDPPIKTEEPDISLSSIFFNTEDTPVDLTLDIDDFGDNDSVRTMTPLPPESDLESDSDDRDSAVTKVGGPGKSQPQRNPSPQSHPQQPPEAATGKTVIVIDDDSTPEPGTSRTGRGGRDRTPPPTPPEEIAPATPDPSDESEGEEDTGGMSDGMKLRRLR